MSDAEWIEKARVELLGVLGELSNEADAFTVMNIAAVRILRYEKEISQLQAEIERLKSERKEHAVAFFRWWWNQGGTNTEDGYDEFIALQEKKDE